MIKVIMVMVLMGTSASTGKNGTDVTAIGGHTSMASCVDMRQRSLAQLKVQLKKADWLMQDGKYHIERANILCVDINGIIGAAL